MKPKAMTAAGRFDNAAISGDVPAELRLTHANEKSRLEGGSFSSVPQARGYWRIFLALFFERLLLFTAFLAGPPALSI